MAEDLTPNITPMDFHPCDTPRGMSYFNMDVLTEEQQKKLNALKIETIRENQKYLAKHPEIRACIALVTKAVLSQRPRTNIHEVAAEYFAKSRLDIEYDIQEYLNDRKTHAHESTSAFNLVPETSFSFEESDVGSISVSSRETQSTESSERDLNSMSFRSIAMSDLDLCDKISLPMLDSFNNIGVNYEKIRKVSSDTIVHSISIITQTADEARAMLPQDEEREFRDNVVGSHIMDKEPWSEEEKRDKEEKIEEKEEIEEKEKEDEKEKVDEKEKIETEEKEKENDEKEKIKEVKKIEKKNKIKEKIGEKSDLHVEESKEKPQGHIPTIKDYDVHYDRHGSDQGLGEIMEVNEGNLDKLLSSVPLAKRSESVLKKKFVNLSDMTNERMADEDMTPLMVKRSVRISYVAPKDIADIQSKGKTISTDSADINILRSTSDRGLDEERQTQHMHLNSEVEDDQGKLNERHRDSLTIGIRKPRGGSAANLGHHRKLQSSTSGLRQVPRESATRHVMRTEVRKEESKTVTQEGSESEITHKTGKVDSKVNFGIHPKSNTDLDKLATSPSKE